MDINRILVRFFNGALLLFLLSFCSCELLFPSDDCFICEGWDDQGNWEELKICNDYAQNRLERDGYTCAAVIQ